MAVNATAFSVEHLKQIYEATRSPQTAERKDLVVRSWARCLDYGLDPSRARSPYIVPKQKMRERQEDLADLIARSRLEIAYLFANLNNDRCALMLADAEGMILLLHGEQHFIEQARRQGLVEGAMWNERHQGTNGMGTCLQEQAPVLINQGQHFFTCHANLNCAAAPIFDPQGRLLGAFDLSSDSPTVHQHTVVLLAQCAHRISHFLFRQRYKNDVLMRLRAQVDNDLDQILMAVDSDGQILAATREILTLTGAPNNPTSPNDHSQLVGQSIEQIVNMPWGRFVTTLSRSNNGIHVTPGVKVNGRWVSLQIPMNKEQREYGEIIIKSASAAAAKVVAMTSAHRAGKNRQPEAYRPIVNGDGEQEVRKGLKAVRSLMPLLISGERGCGKRTLAEFLRGAGPLASVPMVSVAGNDGATMAKILRQIDESRTPWNVLIEDIAAVTLPQQAQLSQILDKNLTGKSRGQLFATSFEGFAELQHKGQLHERLCYQFSTFHLDILPLRARTDKRALVTSILKHAAGNQPYQLAPEVWEKFDHYTWPGNVRELSCVLQAALALAGNQKMLLLEHFPSLSHPVGAPAGNEFNPLDRAERAALLAELERLGWNISKLARSLNVSRNTIYRKVRRLGIPLTH